VRERRRRHTAHLGGACAVMERSCLPVCGAACENDESRSSSDVTTEWTAVGMSTPLLPEGVPGIGAVFFWGRSRSGLKFDWLPYIN